MKKTLSDIIQETNDAGLKESLSALIEAIKAENEKQWLALAQEVRDSIKSIQEDVKSILSKPDPKFPEVKFPEKMMIDRPEWYQEPKATDHAKTAEAVGGLLLPHFIKLLERTANEHEKTRQSIEDLGYQYNKPEQPKPGKPVVKMSKKRQMNLGSVKRHLRWRKASTTDGSLTNPSGDGVTWYLPSTPEPLSETIRLNGGLPILTEDYTMKANAIIFTLNQSGSKIEVRYQE